MVTTEIHHTGCDWINSLVRGLIKTTLLCFEKYNNYVYPVKQHPSKLEQWLNEWLRSSIECYNNGSHLNDWQIMWFRYYVWLKPKEKLTLPWWRWRRSGCGAACAGCSPCQWSRRRPAGAELPASQLCHSIHSLLMFDSTFACPQISLMTLPLQKRRRSDTYRLIIYDSSMRTSSYSLH